MTVRRWIRLARCCALSAPFLLIALPAPARVPDSEIARCEAQDGIRDGLVSDPLSCGFDIRRPTCAT